MGENVCNLPIWQRANIWYLQSTLTNLPKKKPHQKVGEGYEQTFLKRRHLQGQQKYVKSSTSLTIREMTIKTTMRYHLMPVRGRLLKSGKNRCWQGCGEIGMLLHCGWECKLVQPLWKTVWWFLKDLEIGIPCDSANPLLGIYRKNYRSFHYKDTCTCMFIAALLTIAKTWNQPKCPSLID